MRREPRELYGGVGADPGSTAKGETEGARDAAGFIGEFEQRIGHHSRGGGAFGGEVRSRTSLRESLQARIAADPVLAPLNIAVEVGAQGIRLLGQVPDGAPRARLDAVLADAGLGPA